MNPKRKISILFVCYGNICRSPMAEFVMKDLVAAKGLADCFTIESAATSDEEIGNDIHSGTQDVLSAHGVPYERRRARRIRPNDYGDFDLIIALDEANLRSLNRFFNNDPNDKITLLMEWAGQTRGVADPWYTGDFDTTYEDVIDGCNALLVHLTSRFR